MEVDGLLVPIHVGFQSEGGRALGALEAGERIGKHSVSDAWPGVVNQVQWEKHGEGMLMDVLLQLFSMLENPPAETTGQPLGEAGILGEAISGSIRVFGSGETRIYNRNRDTRTDQCPLVENNDTFKTHFSLCLPESELSNCQSAKSPS